MENESVVTEATPVNDVDSGSLGSLTPDQRTEWNKTGELPKSEDAAPSPEPKPKAEAEPAGDSEAPQQQVNTGKPKKTADERIAELEATIEKIRKGSGKETPKVESSPTTPETKPAVQEVPPTRPKPTPEGNGPDGKPYETYEDFVEDLADWRSEQKDAKRDREAAAKVLLDKGLAKVAEAKTRYENFEEVGKSFWDEIVINPDISPAVKAMIDDSDYFADLAYTIGSSKDELAKFKVMPVGKQLRYIALTESLIADELDGKKTTVTEENPAKPQTRAPRPPSEAGGRAASPPDALEAAAKSNDFRAFEAESTRRQLAKLKG